MTMPECALRLGISYHAAMKLVLTRALRGRQDAKGRWHVDEDSVDEYLARRPAGAQQPAAVGR